MGEIIAYINSLSASNWITLGFMCFLLIFYRKMADSIGVGLTKKQKELEQRFIDSKKLRDDAYELLNSLEKEREEVLLKSQDILGQAQRECDIIETKCIDNLQKEKVRLEMLYENRVIATRNRLLGKFDNKVKDISYQAVKELLQEESMLHIISSNIDDIVKNVKVEL